MTGFEFGKNTSDRETNPITSNVIKCMVLGQLLIEKFIFNTVKIIALEHLRDSLKPPFFK